MLKRLAILAVVFSLLIMVFFPAFAYAAPYTCDVTMLPNGAFTSSCAPAGTLPPPPPTDPVPPPGPSCPAVSTVGPRAGFTDLGNLRFDLRPGQIGSQAWTHVGNVIKVGTIFGTYSETPYGTDVQVSISKCPGDFANPICVGNFSRNGGSLYIGGPYSNCTLEPGNYHVNIRHVKYLSNPAVNSCVSPPFGYCTHYVKFN